MKVSIPTRIDVFVVTATMSLMFVALIFWANVQRQVFRELGGMRVHIISCVTWATLLVATFALTLLRSANEVCDTPWFFRIYATLALLVLVFYPASILACNKGCNAIKSNYKNLWLNDSLPTISQHLLSMAFCEERCDKTIEVFVQTYCNNWTHRMLVVWCVIVGIIVVAGIWLWRQNRRRKVE